MSHSRRADWAANVPWKGILGKPAGVGEDTDIGQLKGAGFSIGDIPEWNGTKFVPVPYTPGGGGGGSIGNLNSPGVATKRIKPGSTTVENVWLQEVFDIRQYGADNTGALDSTSNINAAITALNATGGGALIIPAGRYRAAGPMNRILGRCWVHGDGQGSTSIEFQGDGWWVTSGSFFGCTGLTMIGSNAVGTGIKIMDSASQDNFMLTDLRITGFGYSISVDTVNRAGWIERVRLEALELALSLSASDSFVRGISIYNGGDNTKNAFEMTGYRNQVSDFKLLGDAAHFKKGLFVNDGGNHIISGGMIIGCDEEAISLSNGTGGVSGCRVQNISWQDIGTDPDVVSYDVATNWVNNLYEIGTAGGGAEMVLVDPPSIPSDPGANNQVANDGAFFYSYKDTTWLRVAIATWAPGVVATGGVMTTDGAYTIHTFLSSDDFVVTTGGDIDFMIVAGGGGGCSGGGGGGGMIVLAAQTIGTGTFPVVIGNGGAGAAAGPAPATNGANSSFNSNTAVGGGAGGGNGGADHVADGTAGGSGGGGGASNPGISLGGAGTAGQGHAGGTIGSFHSPPYSAAGGGGASAVGQDSQSDSQAGNGGDGLSNSYSGTPTDYAGGGGGGTFLGTGTFGTGGAGGGGDGGTSPTAGVANTGGGGGGGTTSVPGAAGGSGIVIIRYLTP